MEFFFFLLFFFLCFFSQSFIVAFVILYLNMYIVKKSSNDFHKSPNYIYRFLPLCLRLLLLLLLQLYCSWFFLLFFPRITSSFSHFTHPWLPFTSTPHCLPHSFIRSFVHSFLHIHFLRIHNSPLFIPYFIFIHSFIHSSSSVAL